MMSKAGVFLPYFGIFAVLLISSGTSALQCYQCISHSKADDSCNGNIITQKGDEKIYNCSISQMTHWYNELFSKHTDLRNILPVFSVDGTPLNQHNTQSFPGYPEPPMSCVKLELKVNNEHKMMRTCQLADSPATRLDFCKKMEEAIGKHHQNSIVLGYCGLCQKDKCNGTGTKSATYLGTFMSLVVTLGLMGYLHRAV